ncbi:uncharacterized protein LOC133205732 isoform X2 [Saccostrea echinata]|uniref:uncharacterized protein LOC133205732 isoform X2 n=1 Tax=Saccostrea echinata TaxID=191078 RepID=UPI002A828473|nr:uncharacterized protein LOC133205732 isoform X2 [Saccostrea echinata]
MAYASYTVQKLKKELMLRGAVTTGRKTDLIERLEAYERNFNFSGPVIELPAERKVDWPTTGYKQITSEHYDLLPHISEAHIEGYFQYRQAVDRQMMGNTKAIVKGKLLLESERVEALSINCQHEDFFLTGFVRAAMKKKAPP